MSLSAPISAAPAPPVAAVAAVSGPPDFAARVGRFDTLAAAASDTSAGLEQRLSAWSDLQAMSVSGGMVGLDSERRQQLDQITYDSDIGQRAQALSRSYVQTVNAAGQSGGPAAALRAATAQVDSLSAPDKAILFAATLNAADRSGARPYADLQAWRDNTDAQLRMVDYMQQSGAVGTDGRLDYRAAAAKAVSDPQFAQVLRLSQRRDNTSARSRACWAARAARPTAWTCRRKPAPASTPRRRPPHPPRRRRRRTGQVRWSRAPPDAGRLRRGVIWRP